MAIGDHWEKGQVSGWSTTGKVFVPGTGVAVQGDKGFGLQAQFPRAGVYTIQFSKRLSPNQELATKFGTNVYRAQALVTFTVEGNSVTRRVDIGEGTSISGTCQSLNIDVYNFFSQNGIGLDEEFDVSITVTPGTRAQSAAPPIVTTNRFILGIPATIVPILFGTTQFIDIPFDSGANAVFVTAVAPFATPLVPGGSDLVIIQAGGTAGAQLAEANNGILNRWWPYVPGAGGLLIRNNQAAGTILVSVIIGVQG